MRLKHVFVLAATLAVFTMLSVAATAADKTLMMATTTSTDNTGLLDYLAPQFQKDTGIELKWSAMGTGKALQFGKDCNCDVLLVHAPAAEKKFVEEGYGTDRTQLMYNDFVIIGPASDPAGVKGKSIAETMQLFTTGKAPFISRGDNSGTNKKELSLWKAAELPIPEKQDWYVQTGQGMLTTINVAAQKDGYTMTDRGTYIKYESNMKGNPPLKILVEGDKALLNQYSAIAVSTAKCPGVKYDEAMTFIKWMASPKTQKLIGDFKLLGKQLFTPNAGM